MTKKWTELIRFELIWDSLRVSLDEQLQLVTTTAAIFIATTSYHSWVAAVSQCARGLLHYVRPALRCCRSCCCGCCRNSRQRCSCSHTAYHCRCASYSARPVLAGQPLPLAAHCYKSYVATTFSVAAKAGKSDNPIAAAGTTSTAV